MAIDDDANASGGTGVRESKRVGNFDDARDGTGKDVAFEDGFPPFEVVNGLVWRGSRLVRTITEDSEHGFEIDKVGTSSGNNEGRVKKFAIEFANL